MVTSHGTVSYPFSQLTRCAFQIIVKELAVGSKKPLRKEALQFSLEKVVPELEKKGVQVTMGEGGQPLVKFGHFKKGLAPGREKVFKSMRSLVVEACKKHEVFTNRGCVFVA